MKQREFYFDNAKFILIFFVVFGHFIQPFIKNSEIIHALYLVIYSFHMPAFILVSGFFARGFYQKGYIKKFAKRLLVPYTIFQLLYTVFYYYLFQQSQFAFNLFNPQWSLWFLISLFCWHVMLFAFSRFKPLIGLSLAIAIGLAVGTVDWISNYLSLSRTFVFFPMFLLGYYLTKEQVLKLSHPTFRFLAVLAFVATFIFYNFVPDINYQWLFGSKSYHTLDTSALAGIITRLGVYIFSVIVVFSFLTLVPRNQYSFTELGRNTLYVYLLHGFFIQTFRESDAVIFFKESGHYWSLVLIALGLTFLLSSKLITTIFKSIIELRWPYRRKNSNSIKIKAKNKQDKDNIFHS